MLENHAEKLSASRQPRRRVGASTDRAMPMHDERVAMVYYWSALVEGLNLVPLSGEALELRSLLAAE